MKILSVDIGTGTQDIFLYDSQVHIENGLKLVVPSPTMIVHRQVKAATQAKHPILIKGVMMGGGPRPGQWKRTPARDCLSMPPRVLPKP